MALEKVLIQYDADVDAYKQKLTQLETAMKKTQKTEKDGADATVKNTETYKSAADKRKQIIDNEYNNLVKLREQLKKSFTVNDITTFNAAIQESENRIRALGGQVNSVSSGAMKFLRQEAKAVASEVKNIDKNVTSFGSETLGRLGKQIIAAFAVERVLEFGKESILLAAKAEGVKRAFDKLNKPDLLDQLREATRGTLSDLELMSQAVKAERLGVPIQNFASYLRFAQQRARETGESVDYLVQSIVNGIGRQSVRVIDNLGISQVRVREEFRKTGDFAQAVTTIINEELVKQGKSADTNADKIDRLSAKWQNFKVSAGAALLTAIEGVELVTKSLGTITPSNPDANWQAKKISPITPEAEKVVEKQVKTLERLQQTLANLKDEFLTTDVDSPIFKTVGKQIAELEAEIDRLTGKTGAEEAKKAEAELKREAKEAEAERKRQAREREAEAKRVAAENERLGKEGLKDNEKRLKTLEEQEDEARKTAIENLQRNLDKERDAKDEALKADKKRALVAIQLTEAESNSKIAQVELFQQLAQIATASFKESATAQKVFFLFNQALAVAEVFIKLQQELASIRAANAILGVAGVPITVAQSVRARIQAATSIGVIVAQTIPQFKKGGEVGGRPHSEGGTLIEAEKGEWITSVEKTRKYKEELTAMQSSRFEDLIYKNYVIPEIKKAKLIQEQKDGVFNNISESLRLNGFDDYRLYKAIKKNSSVSINNTDELASKISGSIKIKQSNKWT